MKYYWSMYKIMLKKCIKLSETHIKVIRLQQDQNIGNCILNRKYLLISAISGT